MLAAACNRRARCSGRRAKKANRTLLAALLGVCLSSPIAVRADEEVSSHDADTGTPHDDVSGRAGLLDGAKAENVSLPALGSGEVGPTGSFQYTYPIDLPPVAGGLLPRLALSYDSLGGNGVAGVGWTLTGLPAIARVPYGRGIAYDGQDHYVYNSAGWGNPAAPGSRLVPVGNGKYHTYEESWIEARPTDKQCGDGPCGWTVDTGNGVVMRFGVTAEANMWERNANANVTSARGVTVWGLESVTDLAGNKFDVTYHQHGNMLYPSRIRLGCRTPDGDPPAPPVFLALTAGGSRDAITGCTSQPAIELTYENRPDAVGGVERYERRLTGIWISSGGKPLHAYRLAYKANSSRSWLETIERIGKDWNPGGIGAGVPTQKAFPATKLTYGSPNVRFPGAGSGGWQMYGNVAQVRSLDHASGDLDNDGMSEIVRASFSEKGWRIEVGRGSSAGVKPPTALGATGDFRNFRMLLADVTGDGRDDVILWYLMNGSAAVYLYKTTDTGAVATSALRPPNEKDIGALAPSSNQRIRVLAYDANGDQIDDLVFVNRTTGQTAFLAGGSGGLAAPVLSSALPDPGFIATTEAVPSDLDGDGLLDLAFVQTSNLLFRLVVGYGSATGPTAPHAIDVALPAGVSGTFADFHIGGGDANADGFGDLTLAYTGLTATNAFPVPQGRDVRTLLGRADLRTLSTLPAPPAPIHVVDPASFPSRTGTQQRAFWQHQFGDFNGDGVRDMVLSYQGLHGDKLEQAFGLLNGGFVFTARLVSSAASMPDGNETAHLWQTHVGDVDRDGFDDLVRYYSDNLDTHIELWPGSPTGLRPPEVWHPTSGTQVGPKSRLSAATVRLFLNDVNGDGFPDIVVAGLDGIAHIHSGPDDRDLLTLVENGYGGRTEVEYGDAVRMPGVVQPGATSCGVSQTADCGLANPTARPLVTRVSHRDGRYLRRSTTYAYANGRYHPGPAAPIPGAPATLQVRADLSFAWMSVTDEQTGLIEMKTFRQDRPFHRQLATRAILEAGPAALPFRVESLTYEPDTDTRFPGTSFVRLSQRVNQRMEPGHPGVFVETTTSYTYNEHGAVQTETSCAPEHPDRPALLCHERRIDYAEDGPAGIALADQRWIINRPLVDRVRVAASDLVLSWNETTYESDDTTWVEETRSLICDEATQCVCWSDVEDCVSRDVARWVQTSRDRQYDDWGNLSHEIDSLGREIWTTADPVFHALVARSERDVTVRGAPQRVAETSTFDASGQPDVVTDVHGAVTDHDYDTLGRLDFVTHPNGRWDDYQYRDWGFVTLQRVRKLTSTSLVATTWEDRFFDGHGTVYKLAHQSDGPRAVVLLREARMVPRHMPGPVPGLSEKAIYASRPHFDGDTGVVWSEIREDAMGRPLRVSVLTDPFAATPTQLGVLRTQSYQAASFEVVENQGTTDDTGKILVDKWLTTSARVDARGHIVSITDPESGLTIYEYDDAHRLVFIDGPSGADVPQWRSIQHDSWGREVLVTDYATGDRTMVYDDASRLLLRTDARQQLRTIHFDELDRPVASLGPSGNVTWSYDDPAVPNGFGRVTEVSDAAGTHRVLEYDQEGRPLVLEETLDGLSAVTMRRRFDRVGRLTFAEHPDGRDLVQTWTPGGNLDTVTFDGLTVATYTNHRADGRPGTRTTPTSSTTYTYRPDGLLRELYSRNAGVGELQRLGYYFDAQLNIRGIDDRRERRKDEDSEAWTYDYDRLNRLTLASHVKAGSFSYQYDPAGNLRVAGALGFKYPAGKIEQYRGTSLELEATLDDLGRVEVKETPSDHWRYVWDDQSRLIDVGRNGRSEATYVYDAEGRRRKKTVGDVVTWYVAPELEIREDRRSGDVAQTIHIFGVDGDRLLTETDAGLPGTDDLSTILGEVGKPHSGDTRAGVPEGRWWILGNHLRSAGLILDDTGRPVTRYHYLPYGALDESRSTGRNVAAHRYTGQEHDPESGLESYGARYYDTALHRFLSPDPATPGGGWKPQGLNRYSYVLGNPIKYQDPSGNVPIIIIIIAAPVIVETAIDAVGLVSSAIGCFGGGSSYECIAMSASALDLAHGPGIEGDLLQMVSVASGNKQRSVEKATDAAEDLAEVLTRKNRAQQLAGNLSPEAEKRRTVVVGSDGQGKEKSVAMSTPGTVSKPVRSGMDPDEEVVRGVPKVDRIPKALHPTANHHHAEMVELHDAAQKGRIVGRHLEVSRRCCPRCDKFIAWLNEGGANITVREPGLPPRKPRLSDYDDIDE